MQNYIIKTPAAKLPALYAGLCAQGKIGENLIRNGCNQAQFASFATRVIAKAIEQGKNEEELTSLYSLLALGNASQVRQALEGLELLIDGSEKPKSVSAYWQSIGGAKPVAANLDFLTE